MGKKYLSIEEVADLLGVAPSDVTRLREKGEIRAFADRGNWKFKPEDVEQLQRTRQFDSDPAVPLAKPSSDDSVLSDDEELSEQPTIIRKSPKGGTSDSDVRLMTDNLLPDEDDEIGVPLSDSDSDVRLATEKPTGKDPGSDSDVKLVGPGDSLSDVKLVDEKDPGESDSDVKLTSEMPDSDSDVKLAGMEDSDSDVKLSLDSSDSDVRLSASANVLDEDSDSDVQLSGAGSSKKSLSSDRSDSDVRLIPESKPKSSKITKKDAGNQQGTVAELRLPEPDEAGGDETVTFSLGDEEEAPTNDEGSSVLEDDSGISLGGDSGIALDHVDDSGISLDHDSGISLDSDSGISLVAGSDVVKKSKSDVKKAAAKKKNADDLGGTIPMMDAPMMSDDEGSATQLEIPLMAQGEDDSGDFQFENKELDDSGTTNVINLDDEEHADEYGATMVKKKGADDEDLLDEGMFGEEPQDEIEVAEDVVGEDDELEQMDVLGATDDDFGGEVESGESSADFESPVVARGVPAPVEYEWGTGTFVGLVCATVLLIVTGTVMVDLIRNMWHADPNRINPVSGGLLDALKGMFS
ncbi:MAG: helix-turn-helix domain-containing protein [Planctomycetales bacterium]|nr:helix-turn-helix domain-containing protein [Planctomycetales bacterium]